MTYLPQGYQNTTSLLTFYAVDDAGFLVDANAVQFKIKDEGGVAHTPQNDWIDVTTAGKFDVGAYYAIQECDGEGWTVPADAVEGTWSISWRWKLESSDSWTTWSMRFDIVASRDATAGTGFLGVPYRMITSPIAIRTHGLTVAKYGDVALEELMFEVQQYLETACRQQFRPGIQTLKLQGGESERLFVAQPIIGIEFVKANRSTLAVGQDALAISFARIDLTAPQVVKPDPRRNPTISHRGDSSVFSASYPHSKGRFAAGQLNQSVKGVFGFLESDGTVPRMLKRAFTILVYRTAIKFKVGAVSEPAGPMTSKTVDRHSVGYANTGVASVSSALARSKEVQEIIRIYRGPIGLGSPDPVATVAGRFT